MACPARGFKLPTGASSCATNSLTTNGRPSSHAAEQAARRGGIAGGWRERRRRAQLGKLSSRAPTPQRQSASYRLATRDHRRRRCTDAITSTCVLVIVVGLHADISTARRLSPDGYVAVSTQSGKHALPEASVTRSAKAPVARSSTCRTRSGRSLQRAPERNTHKHPFTKSRLSLALGRDRQPSLATTAIFSATEPRSIHSASLTSRTCRITEPSESALNRFRNP